LSDFGSRACKNRPVLRRRLPWLLALPLITAGSIVAHVVGLASAPFTAGTHDETAEIGGGLHERASDGYAGHAVLWLGLIAAIVAVVAIRALFSGVRGRQGRGASAGCFFLLPLIAYSSQELIERLLHAESFPFHAVFEPRFLVGLALQLPFAAATFLLGWVLLRVGEQLSRLLGARPASLRRNRPVALWPRATAALPRVRALSRGHPLRGPPLLA
jgi:hypothetical protein